MKRRGWILLASLTVAVAAAVWIVARTLPNGSLAPAAQPPVADSARAARIPTPAEVADLQSRANAACRCDRTQARPDSDRCWSDYHRAASRFELNGGVASPCGEEATATECFGPGGTHPHCVTTLRMYHACSDAEERTRLAEAERRHANSCSG